VGRQNIRMMLLVTPAKPAPGGEQGPVPRQIWILAFEAVRKSTIAWIGVVRPSRRPLRGLLRACEEIGRFPDPSRRVLPRPACGERGGVRGLLTVAQNPANTRAPLPLTRNPRADALIPTSPRKRGEVAGRDANSFTSSQKNLNLNRKRTVATKAKTAAISPPTTQKPFGLPLNGMPPTFMPQMLAISVAGRNITENIVSI
jgi:hypothetical protein